MYVVIEGIDGSGKSTHAKRLAEELDAVLVVEPTKNPIGLLIRDRINAGEVNPAVMSRLFAADRQDLAERVIRPALAAGKLVISDRNVVSSLVYQSEGDTTIDVVWDINNKGAALPAPDLVVVVEVSVPEATRRLIGSRGGIDTFETEERLVRHAKRYKKLGEHLRWPVVYVDGEGDQADVADRIRSAVREALGR